MHWHQPSQSADLTHYNQLQESLLVSPSLSFSHQGIVNQLQFPKQSTRTQKQNSNLQFFDTFNHGCLRQRFIQNQENKMPEPKLTTRQPQKFVPQIKYGHTVHNQSRIGKHRKTKTQHHTLATKNTISLQSSVGDRQSKIIHLQKQLRDIQKAMKGIIPEQESFCFLSNNSESQLLSQPSLVTSELVIWDTEQTITHANQAQYPKKGSGQSLQNQINELLKQNSQLTHLVRSTKSQRSQLIQLLFDSTRRIESLQYNICNSKRSQKTLVKANNQLLKQRLRLSDERQRQNQLFLKMQSVLAKNQSQICSKKYIQGHKTVKSELMSTQLCTSNISMALKRSIK